MAAQNTQGTGAGSAEGQQRGNPRQTLGIDRLIGTHVLMTGSATLASGSPSTVTVTFPKALSSTSNLYVHVTHVLGSASTAPAAVAAYNLTVNGFQIIGPNSNTDTVNWALIGNPL